MNKDKRGKKQVKVFFLIANMIIATFAFSWLVGATVSEVYDDQKGEYLYYSSLTGKFYSSRTIAESAETNFQKTPGEPTGEQATRAENLEKGKGSTDIAGSAMAVGPTALSTLGAAKGATAGGKNWLVNTPDGQLLVKNTAFKDIKAGTEGTLLKNGETYPLKSVDSTSITEAKMIHTAYGTDMVTLSDGSSMSKYNILTSSNKELMNKPEVLKSFNAESITPQDNGNIIIKGKSGAQTTVNPTTGSVTGQGKGTTYLSQIFGATKGQFWDAALSGVEWAGIAFAAGQAIGGLAGMDSSQTMALSAGLSAGTFAYKFLKTSDAAANFVKNFPGGSLGAGLVVGGIVFVLMYKKESNEQVTFTCKPWQAPVGGTDCEKCNDKAGCSEYRCKSLGQACQLLNVGSTEERCAWVNPKDVKSPGISPWEEVLTKGYSYTDVRIRPPGEGGEPGRMRIVKEGKADGCVEAFTPLELGIVTTGPDGEDEPAQCKIDYNHTLKFDNMAYDFGESNMFRYNHSQKLALPSPAAINAAAPELKHDGTYSLYVRCRDANGNENVDEFVISFCVDKGPDTTAPKIEGTSIGNGMPVKFNQSTVDLDVYVNEPADCKWSREDRSYNTMENEMRCSNNVWEMNNNMVYTCKTNLTGIKDRKENKFYFKCKDQPWLNASDRNVNTESYVFTLIGTEPLNIIDVEPNGTIRGSTSIVSVNVEVETANGYKNGEAICYYNDKESETGWIEFFETAASKHKQRLDLTEGSYKYYIKCVDLGGNRDDNSTSFTVDVDAESPAIVRVYEENQLLKIVADEDSTCKYSTESCNFLFEDGIDMPYANETAHVAEWKTENTYYIRCSDNYGNIPISNTCSMVVRPYDVVEQKVEED